MIIGISGKIGSGKDTIGEIIQYLSCHNHYLFSFEKWCELNNSNRLLINSDWQIKKFADKLKDIVCILIGCTRQQLEDREFKEKPLGKEWDKWHLQELWVNSEDAELVTNLYFNTEEELDKYIVEFNHTYNTHTKVGLVSLTPRTLLQLLGTECGRNIIHPNIWCNSLMQEYKPAISLLINRDYGNKVEVENFNPNKQTHIDLVRGQEIHSSKQIFPNWIITDCRFANEAQAIKDRGGIIIRVERPSLDNTKSQHQSETALDNWEFDHVINNNGTINDLIESVKSLKLEL